MKVVDVSAADLRNFSVIERVASSLSLVGVAFILVTYCSSQAFHKPINRLVFYASIGNIFTNIATLISRDALVHSEGHLCQFQAFLIQMFMPADAYWTFAMACNVYLTFYHKFDALRLRRLEKWYFLCCYGLPLVPAAVFLAINTRSRGPMYGNATLWCWIAVKWDKLRIAVFYAPVWVVIILTLIIYIRAGKDIWVKRKQLRDFETPPPPPQYPPPSRNPFAGQGILQTTQISVNHESASPTESVVQLTQLNSEGIQYPAAAAKAEHTFTTNISSTQSDDPNTSRWSYVEKPDEPTGTEFIISPTAQKETAPRQYSANEANTAIWSYTKVSLLFFVAMMVTWIPSSANRAYSAAYPDQVSLPLEYASALVLPLQGFWNAIIYTTTSMQACKQLWSTIRGGSRRSPAQRTQYGDDDREHHGADRLTRASRRSPNKQSFFIDTSSETELQPRGTSKDSMAT